jgi:DNA polymerase-3 subunit epsilon
VNYANRIQTRTGTTLERSGGLIERVMALLERGPLPTDAIAAGALGIRGHAGAASLAVFELLGDDSRFRVDESGIWSLAAPLPPAPEGPLIEQEWVVVDVETTGGSPGQGHRVTEVAAVHVAGGEVRDVYSTLVNPGRRIPRMITSLTGITDAMVADAPSFFAIAPRLTQALEGRVFVAHNAAFDWRFVSAEMERSTGRILSGRQLCTVRLSRRLLPHLPSRSLGALAEYFDLGMETHHRAAADATATAKLLLRLIDLLAERGIEDWAGVETLLNTRVTARPPRRASPRSTDRA